MSLVRLYTASLLAILLCTTALADIETRFEKSVMVGSFSTALEAYAYGRTDELNKEEMVWVKGFEKRGISKSFLRDRIDQLKTNRSFDSQENVYDRWNTIAIEEVSNPDIFRAMNTPVAVHAYRLDVIEEYDDVTNDDIYMYFITTHDDLVWGKITAIHGGLDEGDSVFLSPSDRGLFGPKGEKIVPRNNTIFDIGIIESDGKDITQLQKLSDAIVDLAAVAIAVYDPSAGASAATLRAETKNLLKLIIEMDGDDRLVNDSVYFTPPQLSEILSSSSLHEFSRFYKRDTTFTSFAYRLNFRIMR